MEFELATVELIGQVLGHFQHGPHARGVVIGPEMDQGRFVLPRQRRAVGSFSQVIDVCADHDDLVAGLVACLQAREHVATGVFQSLDFDLGLDFDPFQFETHREGTRVEFGLRGGQILVVGSKPTGCDFVGDADHRQAGTG